MAFLKDNNACVLQATDRKPLWDTGVVPGSAQDFAGRLRRLLPNGWFPPAPQDDEVETAPVLAGVLLGFGSVFAAIWTLLGQVVSQTRLATMDGTFLDMAAADYFGGAVFRDDSETDASFRRRIAADLVAPRNTRASVLAAVTAVTGAAPRVIEPMNAADCHALGRIGVPGCGGGYGYGSAGLRYGSLHGGQFFIETALGKASAASVGAAVGRVKAAGVSAWLRVEG